MEVPEMLTLKSHINSIFNNLIPTAIKTRKPNAAPRLDIISSSRTGQRMIAFGDNGMGISLQAKHGQVFGFCKRFHDHVEGKGLALFMVKTQVETPGGKIQSELDAGTEFIPTFDL